MISVDGLVAIRSLGLKYLAGADAGGRLVTWAHACDLPDPWVWFEAGDLVMTTGGGLPVAAEEQAEWITKLIDVGVSGIVFALESHAPIIDDALVATADERHFPVLSASFDLQFVTLARTVIESAIESERSRLAGITRLYESYWRSLHARGSFDERLSALESSTGWALEVRDVTTGESMARGRQAVRADKARSLGGNDEDGPVTIPIAGAGTEIALVATKWQRAVSDQPLLQHLGGLIALELEHNAARLDHLRLTGEELLQNLLNGTIALAAVWPELRHRGMTGDIVLACWTAPAAEPLMHQHLHRHSLLEGYAPLLSFRSPVLAAVVPGDRDLLVAVAGLLGPRCTVGISRPLTVTTDITEALRQAMFATARSTELGVKVLAYGSEESDAGLFPRSLDDTRMFVTRVLGALAANDIARDTELVKTLRVFLGNDSNWKLSSQELGIHRQTLVYRLHKVEELTATRVSTSKGAATFWLALEAADRAGLSLSDML